MVCLLSSSEPTVYLRRRMARDKKIRTYMSAQSSTQGKVLNMTIESNVRSYCRAFPVTFSKAYDSYIFGNDSRQYLDFLSACGSLNYGHNHPFLKKCLMDYIDADGIVASLDLYTDAKERFLHSFLEKILRPRQLQYNVQFTGPTGANAIEAALKLARKVTRRSNVIAFTNAFHGCSLGALSLTGNSRMRVSSETLLTHVTRTPFDGFLGDDIDTAEILDQMLADPSGGVDPPAAIVLEVIQGEGGLNVASSTWAQRIAEIARRHGALLIVDEIQSGCGRSGDFFAFESLNIVPDIVTVAKSISGLGLPMSLVLIAQKYDQWLPGEHNGTFRGNNHAFVTAKAAIDLFWSDARLSNDVHRKADIVTASLNEIASSFDFRLKGRGLMQGIDVKSAETSAAIRNLCFKNGLILEACGPFDEVVKLTPPLVISSADLDNGLHILTEAVRQICSTNRKVA
jgi:diaminobutyrate-2-oxoglutarate transaminase